MMAKKAYRGEDEEDGLMEGGDGQVISSLDGGRVKSNRPPENLLRLF